jgi:hypothetical protein
MLCCKFQKYPQQYTMPGARDEADAAAADPVIARREAEALLGKCAIDPIAAQRRAASNYQGEVDWNAANWDNPILQQLSQLSVLSAHDMPAAAHLSLARTPEQRAAAAEETRAGEAAHQTLVDAELRKREEAEGKKERDASALAVQRANMKRAMEGPQHERPEMRQLLQLSHGSVAGDAQFGEIVRGVAEAHRNDPDAAAMLASPGTLPDEVSRMQNRLASPQRALAEPPSPNRAFGDSDIVAYDEGTMRCWAAVPKSMHDVGYETSSQRHIDISYSAEAEDDYFPYREQLTSAEAHLMALEGNIEKRWDSLSQQRQRIARRESQAQVAALVETLDTASAVVDPES